MSPASRIPDWLWPIWGVFGLILAWVGVASLNAWLGPEAAGAFIGSAVGLFAILLGAMFNAHLQRRRDERLRQSDVYGMIVQLELELVTNEHKIGQIITPSGPEELSIDTRALDQAGFLLGELAEDDLVAVLWAYSQLRGLANLQHPDPNFHSFRLATLKTSHSARERLSKIRLNRRPS